MQRNNLTNRNNRSFTLIELLVVLALVAILSVVVILTLNPAELIKQARDSNRLSDLATINTALNLFSTDVTSGFMGTTTVVYVSIPDNASSTCGSLGLPTLPTGYTYNCVTTANLRNTDGSGWIPVNFQRISSNSPISQLPIDPQNTTSTRYYTYVTGGSWKVMATPESVKYMATAGTDGGTNIGQFEVGNNMSLAPFMDGLVGWWKFDEGSGTTATDSSGWGNSGTMYSLTTPTDIHTQSGCKLSGCASFNGTSRYVQIPQLLTGAGTNIYSIGFWSNITYSSTWEAAFGQTDNPRIQFNSSDYRMYVDNTDPMTNSSFSEGQWYFVYVIFTRTSKIVYINGIQDSVAGAPGFETSPGYIGKSGGPNYFNGLIDDFRIYNRALSAAEVLALYNATK